MGAAAERGYFEARWAYRLRAEKRRGEAVYAEQRLEGGSDDVLVAAMARHPILIERPVAIDGACAVVGRPPERVASLLEDG